jgi:plasmid stabilization system protein ParE
MKLCFTPRATADLIEFADYIYAHNPAAGQRVPAAAIYDSPRAWDGHVDA